MTENTIKLPTAEQIKAAQLLYRKMEFWQLEDKILAKFKKRDPNIREKGKTFIKATLVNSFYGARCENVDKVTNWIVTLVPSLLEEYIKTGNEKNIKKGTVDEERINLVQSIALYGRDEKVDGCIVFASKFAHFFIDPNAFPIYDKYARMMLSYHMGEPSKNDLNNGKYSIFYKQFFPMKRQLEHRDLITYSIKEIDHYMWLSGQYMAWKNNSKLRIYPAAKEQFLDPNNQLLIDKLFPPDELKNFPENLLKELNNEQKQELSEENKQED